MTERQIDQDLKQHIDAFAEFTRRMAFQGKYASLYDLISQEGHLFDSDPYTDEEEALLLDLFKHVYPAPRQQQCFYNSQSLALSGGDLGYAEGFVANQDLPIAIEHGWNVLPSGKVVDLTIREAGEKNTCDPRKLLRRAKRNQANAYYGISFSQDAIRKSWLRNKQSLMLLQDPEILKRLQSG